MGAGYVGGAIAVGFATVTNTVENSVLAYVDDADVTAVGADVLLSAIENATIQSKGEGGALSMPAGRRRGGRPGPGPNRPTRLATRSEPAWRAAARS